MGRQERGHLGGDGYKELEMRKDLAKRKSDADSAIESAMRRKPKNAEFMKLRKEEQKKKKRDPRAEKFIHPRGSGRPIKGVNR